MSEISWVKIIVVLMLLNCIVWGANNSLHSSLYQDLKQGKTSGQLTKSEMVDLGLRLW